MSLPTNWEQIKQLERHPLSKEYSDITGPAREQMLATLKNWGIVNDRKITIHDGKVLDG